MIKYYDVKTASQLLNVSEKTVYNRINDNTIPNWYFKDSFNIVGIDDGSSKSNTRIISLINIKGGVAKTTSAVNISTFFALMGFKVLLIDVDHQNHCRKFFEVNAEKSIYDVFFDEKIDVKQCIGNTDVPNLHILISDKKIGILEYELYDPEKDDGNYTILSNRMKDIKDNYDFIIIDSSPSLNIYNINAMLFSTHILIPTVTDDMSFEGIKHLLTALESFRKKKEFDILGAFLTLAENTVIHNDYKKSLKESLGDLLFETEIRKNIALKELSSIRRPIFSYKTERNIGFKDYKDLSFEILKRV